MKNFLFIITFVLLSCSQKPETGSLSEHQMIELSTKAMRFIEQDNYSDFRELFASHIKSDMSGSKQDWFVDLSKTLKAEGIPQGTDIQHRITMRIVGQDSVFGHAIAFMHRNLDQNLPPFKRAVIFHFSSEYGANAIIGFNINRNPLTSPPGATNFLTPLDDFVFEIEDIKYFRVYYDEGIEKRTKFGEKVGIFALEGDKKLCQEMGLLEEFDSLLKELSHSEYDQSSEFRAPLNGGPNPEFIQVEFLFEDLPFGVWIYLPIKDAGIYQDYIVVRQEQVANLGFQYMIKKDRFPRLSEVLKGLIWKNWSPYYLANP